MVRKHGRPGGSALRRPIAVIACLAAAAALLVPSPAAAASPTRIRHYAGVTSEGDAFAITTVVRAGVVRLREVSINGTAACEDGTLFEFGHGLGFAARGPLISDGQLQYEDIAFSDAFFLLGRLGSKGGSGTVTHLFAALDALEEPQVCTTGELTWQVQRVPESNAVVSDVIVTKVVDGVTSTIRFGSTTTPAAQEAEGRIRSYEGRTSARDPLFVITIKHPETVALLELGFGWELACDDGTSIGLGFFILFAEEPLEPQRLDYDIAAMELALHIHGGLGSHGGSGTTTTTIPALTADLHAQGCRTGDLTWRVWRTDPGALM